MSEFECDSRFFDNEGKVCIIGHTLYCRIHHVENVPKFLRETSATPWELVKHDSMAVTVKSLMETPGSEWEMSCRYTGIDKSVYECYAMFYVRNKNALSNDLVKRIMFVGTT
jgi:hypothetical protein